MTRRWTLKSLEAAARQYAGHCVACGRKHYELEPDAREGECSKCGTMTVYGAEELVLMGYAK